MTAKQKRGQHGGRRPGAGRPRELDDLVAMRVLVEREDRDALNDLAAEKGVSAMGLVRRAIRQLLRRHGR
jgi:hypothetical protein